MSKVRFLFTLAALAALPCLGAFAQTTPTIEDVVDVGGYITASIAALAPVVGIAIGGWFSFRLARWAMRWANLIGR